MPTSTWTDMVDFAAGGVVTEGTCNTYLTNNLTYVKSHIDGTAAMHGLPATTFLMGQKVSGGLFAQYCSATNSSAPGAPEEQTISASFPVAFTTVLFYIVNCVLTSAAAYEYEPYGYGVTTTGGSVKVWQSAGRSWALSCLAIGT